LADPGVLCRAAGRSVLRFENWPAHRCAAKKECAGAQENCSAPQDKRRIDTLFPHTAASI